MSAACGGTRATTCRKRSRGRPGLTVSRPARAMDVSAHTSAGAETFYAEALHRLEKERIDRGLDLEALEWPPDDIAIARRVGCARFGEHLCRVLARARRAPDGC